MDDDSILFENYNKIRSTFCWLPNNLIVRVNTSLYRNTKSGGRTSYHSEIKYFNQRANDSCVNIDLHVDTFISIEPLKSSGDKDICYIRSQDIIQMRNILDDIIFKYNTKYSDIFYIEDGVYKINKSILEDQYYKCSYGELFFVSNIIDKKNPQGGIDKIGVITLKLSNKTFSDLDLTSLHLFREALNVNLFMYGQMMLNYLQRPENGTNITLMNSNSNVQIPNGFENDITKKFETKIRKR